MIKANELRVGNLVRERGKQIHKVQEILSSGVRVKYWSCGETKIISFDKIMPVLITPEILEEHGFIKLGDMLEGSTTEYQLHISDKITGQNRQLFVGTALNIDSLKNKKGYCYVNYVVDNHWASNNIIRMNELQNLYFALTGEELSLSI